LTGSLHNLVVFLGESQVANELWVNLMKNSVIRTICIAICGEFELLLPMMGIGWSLVCGYHFCDSFCFGYG